MVGIFTIGIHPAQSGHDEPLVDAGAGVGDIKVAKRESEGDKGAIDKVFRPRYGGTGVSCGGWGMARGMGVRAAGALQSRHGRPDTEDAH